MTSLPDPRLPKPTIIISWACCCTPRWLCHSSVVERPWKRPHRIKMNSLRLNDITLINPLVGKMMDMHSSQRRTHCTQVLSMVSKRSSFTCSTGTCIAMGLPLKGKFHTYIPLVYIYIYICIKLTPMKTQCALRRAPPRVRSAAFVK